MKKILFIFFLSFVLSGCSTTQLIKSADSLNIVFDKSAIKKCKILGEVIGSEGHWYNYLFITNSNLAQGALNDIRNKAQKMGGQTLSLFGKISYLLHLLPFLAKHMLVTNKLDKP